MPVPNGCHLYHYTDYRGFKGIVESNVLWATNLFFLNDAEEFRYGIGLLKRRLTNRCDESDEPPHPIYNVFLSILGLITGDSEGAPLENRMAVYVASFSECGDVLSQWRAYCPNGGLAIGFNWHKLDALAKKQGLTLEECLYDEKKQIKTTDSLLDELENKARESDERAPSEPYENPENRYWDIADDFLWDKVLPILPVLKHWGFSEEKEWRLVADLRESDHPGEVKIRVSNEGVIPYKEIALDNDLWSDARIILSPGSQEDRMREAIRQLVSHKRLLISISQIEFSRIPYRSRPT